MNVAIFGATGRTGRHLVEQALTRGHNVTAFARSRAKLAQQQTLQHERLRVVEGDVMDYAPVERAVRGADVVLSAVGHTKTSAEDVQMRGTENIVSAMKEHGVRRVISETGAGVSDPNDEPYWGARLMQGIMTLVAADVLKDAERHANVLRASELDWTLVRAPRLTDGERTGAYETGYLKMGPTAKISRADVADFMLHLAEEDRYVREAPMLCY